MAERPPLRLGAVNYLNTKPLVHGLVEDGGNYCLSFDLPSRLADDLAAGQLDVALIPSVEFFQNPAYEIISDACIACRGPVLSVKLFSRTPLESIKTLALDEGSRTSAALVQILLRQRFNVAPRLEPLPIGATIADTSADAVLLIGDRAIHSPPGRFFAVWDLGDEWQRWSELPFVFAMWVARPGIDAEQLATLAAALESSRDSGLAHLDAIALREASLLGLTIPQCLGYLRDNLHFTFGPREQRGLRKFHQLAAELNLAPAEANRCFHITDESAADNMLDNDNPLENNVNCASAR